MTGEGWESVVTLENVDVASLLASDPGAVGGMPGSWSVPPVLVSELELVGNRGGERRELPRPPRP